MVLSVRWVEETHRPEKLHKIESSHKPTLSLVVLLDSEKHDGTSHVGDGEADHAETCLVGLLDEPAVRTGINHYTNERESKDGNIPNEEETDDAHDAKGDTDQLRVECLPTAINIILELHDRPHRNSPKIQKH